MIYPVIMAGGTGSRLWPLSRELHPKQFLNLVDEQLSMLQATLTRLNGIETAAPSLICNEQHRFLVAEQLRVIGCDNARILLEPVGRNTAPAIALSALQACQENDDAVLLVLAADHVIEDVAAFHSAINTALPLAQDGKLVTFGIVPTHAETGYGYIQRGGALYKGFAVKCFVEKPDTATAEDYLGSGDYYWNSGMFLFKARRYLDELQTYQPKIFQACKDAMAQAELDLDFIRVNAEAFANSPNISIDYAVMEKTADAAVVPLDAGWSDVGSWSSLWEALPKNQQGNALQGDILTEQVSNSFIHAESRLVTVVGVDNLVIVETKDAVLVIDKSQTQRVKELVTQLKNNNRGEHITHPEVYRPWGKYESIDNGKRYQVKRISVKPGAKLSVQMHHHRSEHWVVVSGTAKVTNGDRTFLVTENESTYIPIGEIHALENPGKIPLELIEVQSGSYLSEDDIVRLKDNYGRV